jgi:hypothetical protein
MPRFFITALACLFSVSVFGQGMVDCSLLSVTDIIVDNEALTVSVAIHNSDNMDTHYPYINYIIDSSGDTIQNGNMNLFVAFANQTTWYTYDITAPIISSYPLTIHFTYSNLTGEEPGDYTCELIYNTSQNITFDDITKKSLIKIVNALGIEVNHTTNQILFHIYDDGSVEKKFIVE